MPAIGAVKSRSTVDKLCCRYCILASTSPLNITPRRPVSVSDASNPYGSRRTSPPRCSLSPLPSTSLSPNIDRSRRRSVTVSGGQQRRSVTPAPITLARSVSGAAGSHGRPGPARPDGGTPASRLTGIERGGAERSDACERPRQTQWRSSWSKFSWFSCLRLTALSLTRLHLGGSVRRTW